MEISTESVHVLGPSRNSGLLGRPTVQISVPWTAKDCECWWRECTKRLGIFM